MNLNTILKYIFYMVVVLFLLFFGYFFILNFDEQKPIKVLTPEVYEKGTTVSLYDNLPPEFPKEIILENEKLNYSGTVQNPEGRKQITVSYISTKTMSQLTEFYISGLESKGWQVLDKSIYQKVSIIKVSDKNRSLIISIAPVENGTMLTFQYEI